MAVRVYLSPIVGTGTSDDAYRPKIADYGVPWVSVIASQSSGHPKFNWAVVLVSTESFTTLDADTSLDGFPNLPVDTLISSLTNAVRQRIQSGMTAKGIPLLVTDYVTVRELVEAIGKIHNPQFSLAALSV